MQELSCSWFLLEVRSLCDLLTIRHRTDELRFRFADTGHISLSAVLESKYIGRSLMVEGGASIISAFLASNLVDLVVITIAPVLIGDGITATQGRVSERG